MAKYRIVTGKTVTEVFEVEAESEEEALAKLHARLALRLRSSDPNERGEIVAIVKMPPD